MAIIVLILVANQVGQYQAIHDWHPEVSEDNLSTTLIE
ncbi:MAG: hypothetical protein ACI9V8_002253 [Urechidicola sp.]|jgi:hypothetical protein